MSIDGITVLNIIEPLKIPFFLATPSISFILIGLGALLINYVDSRDSYIPIALGCVIMGIGVLFFLCTIYITRDNNINKYRYEVLIDEKTPLIEVLNNYEIVEQRGDIYILREK